MNPEIADDGVSPGMYSFESKKDDEVPDAMVGNTEDEEDAPVDKEAEILSDNENEIEEGWRSIGLVQPCKPSREMVEEHNRCHIPFRNWCEVCVRARAVEDQHKDNKHEEGETPIVSMDYDDTILKYLLN